MLNTISTALENFCVHQIRVPYTLTDNISKEKNFITYIDVETKTSKTFRIYLLSSRNFLQRVSNLFLDEKESDDETLKDIALETTNLIIGSAKVIAEELGKNPYTIKTPHFIDVDVFELEYDDVVGAIVDGDEIIITLKELT